MAEICKHSQHKSLMVDLTSHLKSQLENTSLKTTYRMYFPSSDLINIKSHFKSQQCCFLKI